QRQEPAQLLLFRYEDAIAQREWFYAAFHSRRTYSQRCVYISLELRSHDVADTDPAHRRGLPLPVHSVPPADDRPQLSRIPDAILRSDIYNYRRHLRRDARTRCAGHRVGIPA